MLLDDYLARYDVTETHAVVVDADIQLTWQAIRGGDLSRSAVIRVLLELRSLPNRLQRVLTGRPSGPARPPWSLDDMERAGFVRLVEERGREMCSVLSCSRGEGSSTMNPPRESRPSDSSALTHLVREGRVQHSSGGLRQRARARHL